ncbi:MAG: monovalent cation:proton antiporter-2 (CPA2) family protein [Methylotenera sp.]|nr:monovalent cation:proton antiporter-2 (CPA2) family protein [Methylotenera sp.]MDP1960281.1 monovalent cation:proton antiporter-2 (CPA2) family protein [Methylotenera sp.]MDP3206765.1 monovalent cation:proton antiporter-2 (CPA2) family protein [Methylotenera sp.]MDP3304375.1 monovalent cation:proton antiporter-2 (CPA2) family protein [Methylotenera sp.]MDP3942734.1 monovalent cation:proton antiporter-2 (CPA2) family protein [Methylotenera sp.]
MFDTLPLILILLISSVLAVALFRAFRLPAMLAYFLVGLTLGPHTFGLLPDTEANREIAEFGIVFLMFSIGLEFSLPQLYAMRKKVLGLGGAQVIITLALTMGVAKLAGLNWPAAFVVGTALTMSSTAIVSKILAERIDLNSRHGRLSIGVLLFQDIAVVPILVMIPALGIANANLMDVLGLAMLKAAAMLLFLFTIGKWLINPWFNLVASQRSRELFVMNVLMVTLLLAFATKMAGLSYALGAFIAGMLISETKYRYQVESDISPFRDILLGLFFISVGMLLNIQQIVNNIGLVLLILVAFIFFKAAIVAMVVRFVKYEAGVAIRTGVILAQAGEFSFVILALGAEQKLISGQALQLVLAASLLSMVLAPILIQYNGRIARKLASSYSRNSGQVVQEIEDAGKPLHDHVIICGYGRSGQYLGRFLREENIPYIALDIDPSRVLEAAAAGEMVMFGDAARRVVLEAAGGARAKALVISYADNRAAMKILHIVQENYPQLPVIVRTVDDSNMETLRAAGAAEVVPEILEGSLMLASHALMLLGVPLNRVVKRIRLFREERYKLFKGYFHGISDAEEESLEKRQVRLHSVIISAGAYAIGRHLSEIQLDNFEVEIKSIRRPNSNGAQLSLESPLTEGDVIVLLGQPSGLTNAQNALLTGRVATK